jgi:hypothetical protein
MRHRHVAGLLGLAALLAGGAGEAAAQANRPAGWMHDYQAARLAAKQSGKPMFLVFR